MATETIFLKLIKPATGEFEGTWGSKVNENMDLIDTWAKDTDDEIKAARVSDLDGTTKDSLDARISVVDLEVKAARGNQTNLDTRISKIIDDDGVIVGTEIVNAREGAIDLKTNLNRKIDDWTDNAINYAPQDDFIVPDVSGSDVGFKVKANTVFDIQGYYQKLNVDTRVGNLSNSTFYYVYAQRAASGQVPIIGVENTRSYPSPPDRIYIGELLTTVGDLPAANIISYRENARYDSFEVDGNWFTSPSVSGDLGEIEKNHNLGFIPSFCQIFVSQSANPTQGQSKTEIESLSIGRSDGIKIKLTDTKVFIKYEGTYLYKSYDGAEYTGGYLRIVLGRMSKKGVLI